MIYNAAARLSSLQLRAYSFTSHCNVTSITVGRK